MANFGVPKSATGFTLPSAATPQTAATPPLQFNFAGGDPKTPTTQIKPLSLFGSSATSIAASPATSITSGLTLGTPATTTPQFNLGGGTAATSTPGGFSFGAAAPSTSTTTSAGFILGGGATTTGFSLGGAAATTSATATTAPALAPATSTTGFNVAATTSTTPSAFSLETSTSTPIKSLFGAATTTSATTTTAVSTAATTLSTPGTLTFVQLEDQINKWTIDLEEQGKVFDNQAKQLNAWDRLLISNGEKILNVSSGLDRLKQQQQQLDQELDFVVAQQKELEDCIAPLEKELENVPISDTDRHDTYKLAETIDLQLKQMSDELKEIIEHLNEFNKSQELSDPVAQVGRILNAHMNSLQWIDKSTMDIGRQLDDISKVYDAKKKNQYIYGS